MCKVPRMVSTRAASGGRRPPRAAAAVSADTRDRVLDAARALITERGDSAITLVDVAARAGLSRQTIYLLFRNRAGLLLAMVDRIDATADGPRRLTEIREGLPPREAFAQYLHTWLDYLQRIYPIAHALSAAAAGGDREALAAWDSRMQKLRAGYLQFTRGLHKAGALRDGWTPAAAADWLYAGTHVDHWHHLVVESAWPPEVAAERIVQALGAELLTPA